MTATQAVIDRARAMMLDDHVVVELLEEIQESGGPMHNFITRQLQGIVSTPPRSSVHEYHLDTVCYILGEKAKERARSELKREAA